MAQRRGFTLIELLVVVAIVGVLMAIMVPALQKARQRARTVVCMTNQRNLVVTYRQYYADMGMVLSSTGHGPYGAWDYQLLGANRTNMTPTLYYNNNGLGGQADKPRFCPETQSARRPGSTTVGTASLAWDCHYGPGGGSTGSYGMNNWIYNSVGFQSRGTTFSGSDFWQIKSAKSEFNIPVFVDAVWHDFLPKPDDNPGNDTSDPEAGTSAHRTLADACVNRHNRAVNVSFWDSHVENVGLQQLWSVSWSATWQPRNPPPPIH